MNTKRAEMLATDLINYHLGKAWGFGFDNAKRRLGQTNYTWKRITLGFHATSVNDEKDVLNTILHEIAHAMLGPGYGHSNVWKAKHKELGGTGERLGVIAERAVAPYKIHCGHCGANWPTYRRPRTLSGMWHKQCGKGSLNQLSLKAA